MTVADSVDLQLAARKLETQSLAMKVAERLGTPIEAALRMLPQGAQNAVHHAVNRALRQCLRVALTASGGNAVALRSMPASPLPVLSSRAHTAAVAVSGAVGGFFGLPGLLVELPISTTLLLHSIVEIARSQGEDLSHPETALACLEVFALGPDRVHENALESAYYVSRAALAQAVQEASTYLLQKGLTREGAPAVISLVSKVASRFGLEVSEKLAAELIPIAGAAGGLAVNVLFSNHFQSIAEGHFVIRRLERKYGAEIVRLDYKRARLMLKA